MRKSDLIRQELETLAEANNGLLKPEMVVEFAEDPQTALHSRFEWDNTEAARQYRLYQARNIIRITVNVLPRDNEDEFIVVKAFVSMNDDRRNGGGYRTMVDVMTDEQMRKNLLAQAYDDFKLWQKKYQQLKELAPVFDHMAEVVGELAPVTA